MSRPITSLIVAALLSVLIAPLAAQRFAGRVLKMSDPVKIRHVLQREMRNVAPAVLQ